MDWESPVIDAGPIYGFIVVNLVDNNMSCVTGNRDSEIQVLSNSPIHYTPIEIETVSFTLSSPQTLFLRSYASFSNASSWREKHDVIRSVLIYLTDNWSSLTWFNQRYH